MPAGDDPSTLHTVLTFYSSIVTLNAEGDSLVSDETLEGLGTDSSLLETLFGSILRIALPSYRVSPEGPEPSRPDRVQAAKGEQANGGPTPGVEAASSSPKSSDEASEALVGVIEASVSKEPRADMATVAGPKSLAQPTATTGDGTQLATELDPKTTVLAAKKFKLTELVPDPGYFLAGAIAGGASRTATAPLDRLKVYLLVNTKTLASSEVITGAVKQGKILAAFRHVGEPIRYALSDIYRTGGLKNFFAGMLRRCPLRLGVVFADSWPR